MNAVVVEEFRPQRKNTLRGFARIRLASGMVLHDVGIHAGGKIRYAQMISFASRECRERFSALVVDAVRAAHPDAFI